MIALPLHHWVKIVAERSHRDFADLTIYWGFGQADSKEKTRITWSQAADLRNRLDRAIKANDLQEQINGLNRKVTELFLEMEILLSEAG